MESNEMAINGASEESRLDQVERELGELQAWLRDPVKVSRHLTELLLALGVSQVS